MFKSTLQHFAGDFGQTALSSLRFLKGNSAGAPNLGIFWKQQHITMPGAMFLTHCKKCLGF